MNRPVSSSWINRPCRVVIGPRECTGVVVGEPKWFNHDVVEVSVRLDGNGNSEFSYRHTARVWVGFDGHWRSTVVGNVATARARGSSIQLTISGWLADQEHVSLGGFQSHLIEPLEVMWSTAQFGGLHASQLQVHGMRTDRSEDWYVAAPVSGISVEGNTVIVRGVRFTSTPPELAIGEDIGLRAAFLDAAVWAEVSVRECAMAFDADRLGASAIDSALEWMMVTAHTGASHDGDEIISYDRSLTRSRPERVPITYVEGRRSRRVWIRGDSRAAAAPVLPADTATRHPDGTAALELGADIEAAMGSWRRAVEASDKWGACSALSEAVECCVSTVQVDKAFSRPELRTIRESLPAELSDAQLERLGNLISSLNQPSFSQRLDAGMKRYGVIATNEEAEAVAAIRECRNRFVHGGVRVHVPSDQIELAVGFVARLIYAIGSAPGHARSAAHVDGPCVDRVVEPSREASPLAPEREDAIHFIEMHRQMLLGDAQQSLAAGRRIAGHLGQAATRACWLAMNRLEHRGTEGLAAVAHRVGTALIVRSTSDPWGFGQHAYETGCRLAFAISDSGTFNSSDLGTPEQVIAGSSALLLQLLEDFGRLLGVAAEEAAALLERDVGLEYVDWPTVGDTAPAYGPWFVSGNHSFSEARAESVSHQRPRLDDGPDGDLDG